MFRRTLVLVSAALLVAALPVAAGGQPAARELVFSPEGDRLNIYDITDPEAIEVQRDVPSPLDADPDGEHRDTNGQICFYEDGGEFFYIGGEDTNQPSPTPIFDFAGITEYANGELPGWGIFRIDGREVGGFEVRQVGKLVPTYQPHTVSQFEHYGCGFLSDGRLLLTDIGDQYPGFPNNGQLHLWFPPFDVFEGSFCKIDIAIPTAGGIHVDEQDRVYVTAQRSHGDRPAGVYRYSGDWPTSADAAGGCGETDGTGAPMVDAGRIERELFVPGIPGEMASPSAVVASPAGGFYVSSVFDGRINEYDPDGGFVRTILEPPLEEQPLPPFSTGTPLGIALGSDGSIYYADLAVVMGPPPGPQDGEGSIRRIRFDADGDPMEPEILDDALDFPDGLGILLLPSGAPAPPPPPTPPAPPPPAPPAPAAPAALPTTGGGTALVGALLVAGGLLALRRRHG